MSYLLFSSFFYYFLTIITQSMLHIKCVLAMSILHQALRIIFLAMWQATRMQKLVHCHFPQIILFFQTISGNHTSIARTKAQSNNAIVVLSMNGGRFFLPSICFSAYKGKK